MKNLLKGAFAHHMMRHRRRHNFIHNMGAAVLPFAKGRTMIILGAVALVSEFMRRRYVTNHAASAQHISEHSES